MRLANKVAIITGVGAGIGEAIAIRFAQEGATLVLNDISERAGQSTLKKIRDLGGQVTLAVADISKEDGARSISDPAAAEALFVAPAKIFFVRKRVFLRSVAAPRSCGQMPGRCEKYPNASIPMKFSPEAGWTRSGTDSHRTRHP